MSHDFEKISDLIVNKCLNIKKGEKVLIITDQNKRKIADSIFKSANKITDSVLLQIPVTRFDGDEPSQQVYDICGKADVIIAPTTMSLSHTKALVNARKKNARVATLPGINEDLFLRAVDTDYETMSDLTKGLAEFFRGKDNVHVTTEKGTDVTFSIKGRVGYVLDGLCHNKGDFVNLPDGEFAIAPIEDAMNGTIVVDLSMAPDNKTEFGIIGKLEDESIELEIKNGKIISFKGEQAQILKKVLENADENANCIAEFGIGTNPKAKIIGNILEDEKALGTIHFAFGSNVSLGGKNQSNVHLDGVISKAEVVVNNCKLIRKGKIII
ncbi:aminopeptidase [Candidatus Woesearchaeota archaeon]|nr:aminopeptidase [Candidatus Woesearchaeota archaeon]